MTSVPLGVSTFTRRLARTPEVLLTNIFLEKDPTNLVDGLVRLQRPGLARFARIEPPPIRGIFQQAGTFEGRFLVIGADRAFLVDDAGTATELEGEIAGSGHVIIAANDKKALISTSNAEDKLYRTNGETVEQVISPDDIGFSSVTFINGYFIASQVDSQRIWFLAPGEQDFDALSFFAAENSADNALRVSRIGDELWIFGETSIEVWVASGDADLPFQRIEGRLYLKGCANKHTVAGLDNTLFWVGNDKIVYRAAGVPERISDNGIEERLRNSDATSYIAWAFLVDGHSFYSLTIGGEGTFVYDVSTQTWSRWQSYGRETWRAVMGTQSSGSFVVACDDTTGDIWQLDPNRSNDDGEPMVRELVGGVPVLGRPQRCNSFTIYVASGHVSVNLQPTVMMRWSDDSGVIWTDWDYIQLGLTGDYEGEYTFWGLGLMTAPGRVFHIRMTDNALFRISYARVNEAFAA